MSELALNTAALIDMLPQAEQLLAYEMMKRIVLAWDPDFTKLTEHESALVAQAEEEFNIGNTVSHDQIEWDA